MQCAKCKSRLPAKAKYCPQCGAPAGTRIQVKQKAGKVKGRMVGAVLGEDGLPPGLKSTTIQDVDSVEAGGTVVGTVVGEGAQVGDRISVGDITGSTGVGIGQNVKISATQGDSAEEIAKAFSVLFQAVQTLPDGPDKTMAQAAVQGLEAEARKEGQAEESSVRKWFSFLSQMAPDIWEVAVETFKNPIKGLSTVFQKIAGRAKQEQGK